MTEITRTIISLLSERMNKVFRGPKAYYVNTETNKIVIRVVGTADARDGALLLVNDLLDAGFNVVITER